jgi:sortase A
VSTLRRVVDIIGRVLIGLGVLVLLFTAYQIWGTSVQEAQVQSGLRTQLQKDTSSDAVKRALAQESAVDKLPTGPPVAAPTTTAPAEGEPIGDIRIPIIGLNQVVVEGTNTPDLRKGPGHYTGTPLPGQAGNTAVAGHRTTYGHPFYNLDSVKVGDPIVLTTLQGIFVYDATKSFVVSPSDTTVVDNVIANQITLTTCNPRFSATTRLVVQAKLAHSQLFANAAPPVQQKHVHHHSPKSESLAGDSGVSLADALFWGFVTAAVVTGIFFAAHYLRRQRWVIYGAGAVGTLVLLWFFFGAVSPLLPASF